MDIVCSAVGIADDIRPAQGINDIANAGFENISLDVNMFCRENELEYFGIKTVHSERKGKNQILENPSKLVDILAPVLGKCRENGLGNLIVRAPYLQRDTKRTDLNDMIIQLAKESISLCKVCGCKYVVVRPLFAGVEHGMEWQVNMDFYLQLAESARQNDVMILIENQCYSFNGHLVRGFYSDADTVAGLVDELNNELGEERFGLCVDTGVCSLCGQDMYEFIHILGKRVKAVVIRDCNGHDESSLLPFTCVSKRQSQTNWLSLIRGLREITFDGIMILDMEDTASAFSPLLRPQLLTLARAVMDFLKFQVEIESILQKYKHIILFGAGNMCRNYMKCYGEKYPPLFTCDNNKALWGTSFCGLEVKNPEELRNISDDCVVFICNVYYREIEKQLRDMGVKNIEFFNDEYMPSLHFDRLERG